MSLEINKNLRKFMECNGDIPLGFFNNLIKTIYQKIDSSIFEFMKEKNISSSDIEKYGECETQIGTIKQEYKYKGDPFLLVQRKNDMITIAEVWKTYREIDGVLIRIK